MAIRPSGMRLSPHVYNTAMEMAQVLRALEGVSPQL